MGAYMRTNGAVGSRNVAQFMSGPYRIPNIDVDVTLFMTNKTPVGTYRGPGRFETDFFRERLFDMVAKDLGIDRVDFRRRNLSPNPKCPMRWRPSRRSRARTSSTAATIRSRSTAAWPSSAGMKSRSSRAG
jgi:CO/xanthine dehydrogenase Mo-binding subunit